MMKTQGSSKICVDLRSFKTFEASCTRWIRRIVLAWEVTNVLNQIDGGGIRGLSELIILKEIMQNEARPVTATEIGWAYEEDQKAASKMASHVKFATESQDSLHSTKQ